MASLALAPAGSPLNLPRNAAVLTIVGFWVAYFVINTAKAAVLDYDEQLHMIPRRAAVTMVGMLLAGGFHLVLGPLRDWPARRRVSAIAVACVPFALVYSFTNYLAFYFVAPSPDTQRQIAEAIAAGKGKHMAFKGVVDGAISWYFFFAAWGAVTLFVESARRGQEAERAAARYRAEAQDAQLRALRYQVNPHFLFNALNSLSTMVMGGRAADAERMILNLSTFYRTSLAGDAQEDVPLAEELRLQRLYLDIEAVRFPSRLRVDIDVAGDVAGACVPALLLQPLIENAIKHGVARSAQPVTVGVRAWREGERLRLEVANCVADGTAPPAVGAGVGLANVRARLEARFGGEASAGWTRSGGRFTVGLSLPYERHGC